MKEGFLTMVSNESEEKIMIKVKDLEKGKILWYKDNILGIKGLTLGSEYDEEYCKALSGNQFDYVLIPKEDANNEISKSEN